MVQSAFVYKTGPVGPEYLGKKEFDLPLRADDTNAYIHQRERHVVHVDRIEPTAWKPNSGVLPTVYVSAVGTEAKSGPRPKTRKQGVRTKG
jgi:hypothetical protein